MYSFDYHRPVDLAAARSLYAGAEDPMYLSGGMTLIPSMKRKLGGSPDLIDLSGLQELQGIEELDSHDRASLSSGGADATQRRGSQCSGS